MSAETLMALIKSSAWDAPRRIYFMKPVGLDGPIKIGCSEMQDRRLETFMAWSPWPLEIIASVPGHFKQERFLHRCFASSRSHLEWFNVTPPLLEVIDKAKAGAPIEEICSYAALTEAERAA